MIGAEKALDTNSFFAGGAGMFLQYYDIVKPVYLYAVIQMILTGQNYGLPTQMISRFSQRSILEWYRMRKYINPLRQLDYRQQVPPEELDALLQSILEQDATIYKLSAPLSTMRLFHVYRQQHMQFPVYLYAEQTTPGMIEDCHILFRGIQHHVVSGSLKDAIMQCNQNFTYIFSDIELAKNAADLLMGTCSHILLAQDYRYNYQEPQHVMKYHLGTLARQHPFIRMGTIVSYDPMTRNGIYRSLS